VRRKYGYRSRTLELGGLVGPSISPETTVSMVKHWNDQTAKFDTRAFINVNPTLGQIEGGGSARMIRVGGSESLNIATPTAAG